MTQTTTDTELCRNVFQTGNKTDPSIINDVWIQLISSIENNSHQNDIQLNDKLFDV